MGATNRAAFQGHDPKVSVITPTADRQKLLEGTYYLLKNQSYTNWEWLIYDSSHKPLSFSDSRVCYVHDPQILTIGEKRNRLIEKAKGEIIVHFDDDDYYASSYLKNIVARLKEADFLTLHSWFSYDTKTHQFFYWDTTERGEMRYQVDSLSGLTIKELDFGPLLQGQKELLNRKGQTGYGFSYAYKKTVTRKCAFPDLDLAEDRKFYEAAEKGGFQISTYPEQRGETVHVIHETNTSIEYPQYRIPRFLIETLCPPFFSYIVFHEKDCHFSC
jgi:glycosyltransferase involved in cell wall biosynthesis